MLTLGWNWTSNWIEKKDRTKSTLAIKLEGSSLIEQKREEIKKNQEGNDSIKNYFPENWNSSLTFSDFIKNSKERAKLIKLKFKSIIDIIWKSEFAYEKNNLLYLELQETKKKWYESWKNISNKIES